MHKFKQIMFVMFMMFFGLFASPLQASEGFSNWFSTWLGTGVVNDIDDPTKTVLGPGGGGGDPGIDPN